MKEDFTIFGNNNKEIMYKKGRIHRLRNASLTFRSALSVDCVLSSPDVTVLEGFDAFEIPVKMAYWEGYPHCFGFI